MQLKTIEVGAGNQTQVLSKSKKDSSPLSCLRSSPVATIIFIFIYLLVCVCVCVHMLWYTYGG